MTLKSLSIYRIVLFPSEQLLDCHVPEREEARNILCECAEAELAAADNVAQPFVNLNARKPGRTQIKV